MRQGLLFSVLLIVSLLFHSLVAHATQMEPITVKQWLKDEHIHRKVSELMQYVENDELDSLKFALERLALPQQEVARFVLLDTVEKQSRAISPKMSIFLERQMDLVPVYHILERGDGYEFVTPAFNYPAIASRLLKQWQQDQTTLAFILSAERQELNLKQWLSGSNFELQTKEALLIRELDSLSPDAISFLTEQLTTQKITSWLPSSKVMVQLAKVSKDEEVYRLLWRMRADFYSESELVRLSGLNDEFSVSQVMRASENPVLKQQALTALTKVKPMSEGVKQFLVAKMRVAEDATLVAHELEKQGYRSWLEELVGKSNGLNTKAILQVLSQ
ncbi:hypothetical protein [uncultured Vibrio sp.]|uniref:hypothetical protein n=1 Tax=uncultured Vibrio sp. TaxID=114054 RepID=UPI0009232310|nr:hypothetical protein [uncultured Vibrio sp.]OIQ24938.1 MAG: hypothetical protein BM561_07625 [Vibrio sp. MedPE-SWchi]